MRDNAEAQYDVAIAQADATQKVEKEKCDALTGESRDACQSAADAAFAAAKADASLKLDQAKAVADAQDN